MAGGGKEGRERGVFAVVTQTGELVVERVDVTNIFAPDNFYPERSSNFRPEEREVVDLVGRMMVVAGVTELMQNGGIVLRIGGGDEGEGEIRFVPSGGGESVLSIGRDQRKLMVHVARTGATSIIVNGTSIKELLATAQAIVGGATRDNGLEVVVCRGQEVIGGVLVGGFGWPKAENVARRSGRRKDRRR